MSYIHTRRVVAPSVRLSVVIVSLPVYILGGPLKHAVACCWLLRKNFGRVA